MNIRIGTILVKKLLDIANKENVKSITGWMSYESELQKERQIAFYTNNGFLVDDELNLIYEI